MIIICKIKLDSKGKATVEKLIFGDENDNAINDDFAILTLTEYYKDTISHVNFAYRYNAYVMAPFPEQGEPLQLPNNHSLVLPGDGEEDKKYIVAIGPFDNVDEFRYDFLNMPREKTVQKPQAVAEKPHSNPTIASNKKDDSMGEYVSWNIRKY